MALKAIVLLLLISCVAVSALSSTESESDAESGVQCDVANLAGVIGGMDSPPHHSGADAGAVTTKITNLQSLLGAINSPSLYKSSKGVVGHLKHVGPATFHYGNHQTMRLEPATEALLAKVMAMLKGNAEGKDTDACKILISKLTALHNRLPRKVWLTYFKKYGKICSSTIKPWENKPTKHCTNILLQMRHKKKLPRRTQIWLWKQYQECFKKHVDGEKPWTVWRLRREMRARNRRVHQLRRRLRRQMRPKYHRCKQKCMRSKSKSHIYMCKHECRKRYGHYKQRMDALKARLLRRDRRYQRHLKHKMALRMARRHKRRLRWRGRRRVRKLVRPSKSARKAKKKSSRRKRHRRRVLKRNIAKLRIMKAKRMHRRNKYRKRRQRRRRRARMARRKRRRHRQRMRRLRRRRKKQKEKRRLKKEMKRKADAAKRKREEAARKKAKRREAHERARLARQVEMAKERRPTSKEGDKPTWVGCYKDGQPRAMERVIARHLSLDACAALAKQKGYTYIGRQWRTHECWGSKSETYSRWGSGTIEDGRRYKRHTCHMQRDGAYVGGAWANAVYSL